MYLLEYYGKVIRFFQKGKIAVIKKDGEKKNREHKTR